MRILKVIPYYFPELKFGGPPLKAHTLARCLRAEGADISVLTFDSENPARSETIEIEGVPVHYLPWKGRGLRQYPLDLEAIRARVAENDLIHLYGLYTLICPIAARACRKLSKPYLCEPLGMYPPRQRNLLAKHAYNATVTKWMFHHAEKIVATSQPESDDLTKVFPPSRITVRRNGIDLAAFQQLPPREQFLQRHDLDTRKRHVLYLGRISPIKNLEVAIRAFKEANIPDCLFVMVGPAMEKDYLTKLHSLIRQLDLGDTVRILPPAYDDQRLEALSAADLVILPSISESFGNAAGEAVAAGTPVLVTTGCGIASIVHKRAGLAVEPDIASLSKGLHQLLSSDLGPDSPVARIEDATRDLSWDKPVLETITLYENTLAPTQGPELENQNH